MTPVTDTALDQLHAAATSIFTGALEASSIETAFDRRLRFEGNVLHRLLPDGSGPETINLSNYKRIFVIAIGKAAEPMLETLLDRMKRRKGLRGICCSTQIPKTRNWRIRYFLGGHPLPNEDSFESARAALVLLKKARKDTLVFFLVSGGGSAMFDLPLDPQISLEDAIVFNQALIGSGAPISEINTLRKHFSAVKGGRLAIAAPEAAKVSLLLPDVPLRSLDALASGPTTPDRSTVGDVRDLIARYHLEMKFPPSVRKFFDRDDLPESPGNKSLPSIAGWRPPFMPRMPWSDPPPAPARRITSASAMSGEDDALRDSVYEVLLSSHDLVESARIQAQKLGYFVAIDNSCDDWDYADAARYLLERFHHLRLSHPRLCLLSGGEVTVTLSRSPGAGGRNQQFALACALELERHNGERITVLSAGSDGIDGNTRAAGAIADPTTVARARAFGFQPETSLADFNACPLFTSLGDSVVTGPTGHNLRDLRILLAEPS
jgi:glycerate 2-kinase